MNRRQFLKAALGGAALAAAVPAYAAWVEPYQIEVVEQRLAPRRFGAGLAGLRAVQISDLHVGPWFSGERLGQVVRQVLDLQPDLVFFTGDFLTQHADFPTMRSALYDPLRELAGRTAVFSVLGNHDFADGKSRAMQRLLKDTGIQDVTNAYASFENKGETLYIAGVGTLISGDLQLGEVSKSVPASAATILLAHEPDVAQWSRKMPQFVLQLSGHSHGGQIVLPFSAPTFLPWMGELYPAGLYELDSLLLYTNRGLGMTNLPFRLNCPPEITVFTFASGGSA